MSFLRHKRASKSQLGELLPLIDFRQPSNLSLVSCSPAELISVFLDFTNINHFKIIDTNVGKYLPTFLSITPKIPLKKPAFTTDYLHKLLHRIKSVNYLFT
ncbi:MAG: hypothetical protein RIQ70_517 [Bacteroidota bacterium]|jgi:hypothetical protein